MADPFISRCPNCEHEFSLAELKRMAVGDGWQRYLVVKDANGANRVVSFDQFNPATMELAHPNTLDLAQRKLSPPAQKPGSLKFVVRLSEVDGT